MRTTPERRQGPTAIMLLGLIEEFLTLNDMDNDGNYFGWLVCGDRTLVQRLREGGDVTTTKMDDIISFLYKPEKILRSATLKGPVTIRYFKPLKPRSVL